MKSPGDALVDASARQRRGALAVAGRICRKVIKAEPANLDALYLPGMLCLDDGRSKEVAQYTKRALDSAAQSGRRVGPGRRLAYGTSLQRSGEGLPSLVDALAGCAAPGVAAR